MVLVIMAKATTPLDALITAALGPTSDAELARRQIIARGTLRSIRSGHRPMPRVIRKLAAGLGGISEHIVAVAVEETVANAEASR